MAVDLRTGSPTFLQWFAVELSAENYRMTVIPEGCAHGFQVLEAESGLLYLHTAFYNPSSEGGVRFDDPILTIKWPIKPSDISDRDTGYQLLNSSFAGVIV